MEFVVRRPVRLTTYEQLRSLLIKAFAAWNSDKVPRLAASLSFYAVLSLAPLLVLAVALASPFLGSQAVRSQVFHDARLAFGGGAAELLDTLLVGAAHPAGSIAAAVVGLTLALFGASNLFLQLEDSVMTIWKLPVEGGGWKKLLTYRAFAVLLVIAFALLIFAWLALDAWLGWFARHLGGRIALRLASLILSLIFMFGVSAIAFKALPRRLVAWPDVWPGAILTAIGFVATKYLLSLYFSFSSVSSVYGSAGALVVILLWTYYMSQIFFFGLEVTCVYAHQYGSHANEPDMRKQFRASDS